MGLVGEYRKGNITETMHKSILQQRIRNPRKEQDLSEDNWGLLLGEVTWNETSGLA